MPLANNHLACYPPPPPPPLIFIRLQPLRLDPFVLRKVAHSRFYFLSTLEWGNVGGVGIAGEVVVRQTTPRDNPRFTRVKGWPLHDIAIANIV